jgi:acetyl-CoA decarbonylase/synthase complex subunit beta
VIGRFVDPDKISPRNECFEISEIYSGEKVTGKEISAFELVLAEEVEEGIEIRGELKDRLGVVIFVSGVSDEVAGSLESLISEVMNKIKGLKYDFRKDKVVITVDESLLNKKLLECLGKVIYDAFKSLNLRTRVLLIADEEEFVRWIERARKAYESRIYEKSEEEVEEFYGCKSCQSYLPNHVCIITPERPSPCGTRYVEAKAAKELGVVHYYFPIKRGEKIDIDEYAGVNSTIERESGGKIKRIKIHSVVETPTPTGLYPEIVIFYIPEKNGFGIVDRGFKDKTPIGMTFSEMERILIGSQVSGFVGQSFEYLKSKKFLAGEGGWERVVWMSPKVEEYVRRIQ